MQHSLVPLFLASIVHVCFPASPTVSDRSTCGSGSQAPATRVDTSTILAAFRTKLEDIKYGSNFKIEAFIVGAADAHNSEYVAEHDKRRAYVSGFSGSAGTAVITKTKAALWTDGRYFLEAEEFLDCNWILMKSGLETTPSIAEWLDEELQAFQYVGIDSSLISNAEFKRLSEKMGQLPNTLKLADIGHQDNPVDAIWTTGRPAQPLSPVSAFDIKWAGKTWQEKVTDLRNTMLDDGVGAFVVTNLDEVVWLFNIRASDIPFNPFLLSYAIVEESQIRLYMLNKTERLAASLADRSMSNTTLVNHFNTSAAGTCKTGPGDKIFCVEVKDYNDVINDIKTLGTSKKIGMSYQASYAIYKAADQNKVSAGRSPIALAKSQKNPVEQQNMKTAHNRDSAALIKFLAFMEKQIKDGKSWTEISASNELTKRRKALPYNKGLSFDSISSFGSNGAIIHYRPDTSTDKTISTDSFFLLDSGGQYLGGTTDVTRTMHYGKATDYQKECYTRVLLGAINLAMLKWPQGLYGYQLDTMARSELWSAGLVYRHGTGHGIGAYLSVHEGPGTIRQDTGKDPSIEPLTAYQFYSDEPGYYEDGKFGIRLETIVMVSPHEPKYKTANEKFYEFSPITLVPFETELIDFSLMNFRQMEWLNRYNKQIRDTIVPLLGGDDLAKDWVNARTEKISSDSIGSNSATYTHSLLLLPLICLIVSMFL